MFNEYVIEDKKSNKESSKLDESIDIKSNKKVIIPEMELICGDFLDHSWNPYDVIFLSSTTFSEELMSKISKKTLEMKSGAILISLTKRIPELKKARWRLYDGFRRNMSWGMTTIYFHQVRDEKKQDEDSKFL